MFLTVALDYYSLEIIIILAIIGLALFAQFGVHGAMNKYNKVPNSSGYSGKETAERMLREHGIYDVSVVQGSGFLGDYYDPKGKVIQLSPQVFQGRSITSSAVASHEVGHAIQHAESYGFLAFRNNLLPVVMISNHLYWILIFVGLIFDFMGLFLAGIILFGIVAFFQLITLPVEFNASSRAIAYIEKSVDYDESRGARKVLSAAAFTYVAALIISALTILRYVLIFSGRRSRR